MFSRVFFATSPRRGYVVQLWWSTDDRVRQFLALLECMTMPPEHAYGIWSLIPPVFAIALAIATRRVFLSLFVGIWTGYLVINGWNPLTGTLASFDACVNVFQDSSNTCVILFVTLVGSLVALIQRSGGVDGFVDWAHRSRLVRGRRSAQLLAIAVGALLFIETSISCLVTGAVARPLFDKLRIPREKLAYICDTTSAPVCILIPLNAWGAFIIAQLSASAFVDNPVALLIQSIPYNFYALISLAILLFVSITGKDLGPMRHAEKRALTEGKLLRDGSKPMISDNVLAMSPETSVTCSAGNMLLPILVVVAMVPVGIFVTGRRNLDPGIDATFWEFLRACSGSTSVFWAVATATIFAGVLFCAQEIMNITESVDVALKGAAALLPLAVLMILAFAIGHLCRYELKTGDFVASMVGSGTSAWMVAPLIFVVSGGIAFCTGTSFGTFAIMLAVALPVIDATGASQALTVAAVLGGGVFGDHCSPISDTTMVASMASASDHIDHVRTQLPYALAAGTGATLLYAVAGLIL